MSSFLESYLVSIGFATDEPSFHKLQTMMESADKLVNDHASGMAKKILEAQGAIIGAFTSISGAIIGVVDHAAMMDQQFRLSGLRLLMTTDSARKLDIITKALGADIGEIRWDPELRERAGEISEEIDKVFGGRGSDRLANAEKQMKAIRDLRFQFTLLDVGLKGLAFNFASDLAKKMGIGDLTTKIHEFVEWFTGKIPELSNKLSNYAIPALEGTWRMLKAAGEAGKEFGVLFTNAVGLLSGDKSIEGATFSFDKLATAIGHVGSGLETAFTFITKVETALLHFSSAILLVAQNIIDKFEDLSEKFAKSDIGKKFQQEFEWESKIYSKIGKKLSEESQKSGVGGTLGFVLGSPAGFGPLGQVIGKDALNYLVPENAQKEVAAGVKEFTDPTDPRNKTILLGPIHQTSSLAKWITDSMQMIGTVEGNKTELHVQTIRDQQPTAAQQQIIGTVEGNKTEALSQTVQAASKPIPVSDRDRLIDSMATAITKFESGKGPNPINVRQNNPGNLRSWGDYPVVNGYVQFPDWSTGMKALRQQIAKNIDRNLTMEEFFAGKPGIYYGFASAEDKNNPRSYANKVAHDIGIDPNLPLNTVVPSSTVAPSSSRDQSASLPVFIPQATTQPGKIQEIPMAPQSPITMNIPAGSDGAAMPKWMAPQDNSKASFDENNFAALMQYRQAPSEAAPRIMNNNTSVSLGGINVYVTNPGASAQDIAQATREEVRQYMKDNVQQDLVQLSPTW